MLLYSDRRPITKNFRANILITISGYENEPHICTDVDTYSIIDRDFELLYCTKFRIIVSAEGTYTSHYSLSFLTF
jgi:hypothetical protein